MTTTSGAPNTPTPFLSYLLERQEGLCRGTTPILSFKKDDKEKHVYAHNQAVLDKGDPHAYNRAMCHQQVGLC